MSAFIVDILGWNRWVKNVSIDHDYIADVRTVLLRLRGDDSIRSELELEVIFKWVMQYSHADPTGIARLIMNCKNKRVVVNALQQLRLECFYGRDGIVFQGNLPKQEDGHFTILRVRAVFHINDTVLTLINNSMTAMCPMCSMYPFFFLYYIICVVVFCMTTSCQQIM